MRQQSKHYIIKGILMRINKYLALAGLGSRRGVEELVKKGVVTVNGKTITDLATDIGDDDVVRVDGKNLTFEENYKYYILNKPKGYVTTSSDEKGRKTVMDLVKDIKGRVFPVGRLDYNTEGLLILTNDGDLAQKLMLPVSEIEKTYICVIKGNITEGELAVLRAGVKIDGVKLKKCKIKVLDVKDGKTRLEIKIHEGKNRQIRKMLEYVGKEITLLKRVGIGDLRVGGLSRGEYRELKEEEVAYLVALCGL